MVESKLFPMSWGPDPTIDVFVPMSRHPGGDTGRPDLPMAWDPDPAVVGMSPITGYPNILGSR